MNKIKLMIILESSFYSNEQNEWNYDNMIELEWELPFLPRTKELFDCDTIIKNMPEFDPGDLCWSVESIDYRCINGTICPVLWLIGE